jgi:hypothetical protein
MKTAAIRKALDDGVQQGEQTDTDGDLATDVQ